MSLNLKNKLLFVSDIDGTLLKNFRSISNKTRKTIKRAINYKKGDIFKFVLATGRPTPHLEVAIGQFGLDKKMIYGISCNGAVVQDFKLKEPLFFKYIEEKDLILIKEIYEKHLKWSNYSHFSTLEKSYKLNENLITYAYESWIRYSTKRIDKMDRLLGEKVAKVATFSISKAHALELYKDLEKQLKDQVTLYFIRNRIIEIMPKDVNKLKGVKILQKHLKIEDNQVVVVGDSINDIEMLKYYQNSYAVKNADEDVLKAAKNILEHTSEEDAIANLILKIMN